MTDEKTKEPDGQKSEVMQRALEDRATTELAEQKAPPQTPDEIVIEDVLFEILRQYERGYDTAHDDEAGGYHLLAQMTERLMVIHGQGYLSADDRKKLIEIAAVDIALIKWLDRVYGRPTDA